MNNFIWSGGLQKCGTSYLFYDVIGNSTNYDLDIENLDLDNNDDNLEDDTVLLEDETEIDPAADAGIRPPEDGEEQY